MMNNNKAWGMSLMVIGISALIINVAMMIGIVLPVVVKGILAVGLVIALPVLGYTTEKVVTRTVE